MPPASDAAALPHSYSAIASLDQAGLQALLDNDPKAAASLLAAAARYGVVEAQLAYAQCLLDGRGVAQDRAAAFAWFGVAAAARSVEACNMLGRCHELGWGTPADPARAAEHYRQAAEAGLDWGQYNLANLLLRGAGLAEDRAAAFAWYRRAAAQGHAKSMNLLGRFLEEGWIGPADPAAALLWYRRAAEGGDFRGQFNYGTLLARQGEAAAAAAWFSRAAATGSRDFLRSMARALAGQPGFRAPCLLALRRCAAAGDPADAVVLARTLLEGDAAERQEARDWLRRARAAGHPDAATLLRGRQRRIGRRLGAMLGLQGRVANSVPGPHCE